MVNNILIMYEMYAQPKTSLGDIIRYFNGNGITTDGMDLTRNQISHTLRNPVYV